MSKNIHAGGPLGAAALSALLLLAALPLGLAAHDAPAGLVNGALPADKTLYWPASQTLAHDGTLRLDGTLLLDAAPGVGVARIVATGDVIVSGEIRAVHKRTMDSLATEGAKAPNGLSVEIVAGGAIHVLPDALIQAADGFAGRPSLARGSLWTAAAQHGGDGGNIFLRAPEVILEGVLQPGKGGHGGAALGVAGADATGGDGGDGGAAWTATDEGEQIVESEGAGNGGGAASFGDDVTTTTDIQFHCPEADCRLPLPPLGQPPKQPPMPEDVPPDHPPTFPVPLPSLLPPGASITVTVDGLFKAIAGQRPSNPNAPSIGGAPNVPDMPQKPTVSEPTPPPSPTPPSNPPSIQPTQPTSPTYDPFPSCSGACGSGGSEPGSGGGGGGSGPSEYTVCVINGPCFIWKPGSLEDLVPMPPLPDRELLRAIFPGVRGVDGAGTNPPCGTSYGGTDGAHGFDENGGDGSFSASHGCPGNGGKDGADGTSILDIICMPAENGEDGEDGEAAGTAYGGQGGNVYIFFAAFTTDTGPTPGKGGDAISHGGTGGDGGDGGQPGSSAILECIGGAGGNGGDGGDGFKAVAGGGGKVYYTVISSGVVDGDPICGGGGLATAPGGQGGQGGLGRGKAPDGENGDDGGPGSMTDGPRCRDS